MRPTSRYLEWVRGETSPVKLNLANTSPQPDARLAGKLQFDISEAGVSRAGKSLVKILRSKLGAGAGEVALAPGTSQAFAHALAAITEPGDKVLVETPTYEPFLSTTKFLGLKVQRFQRIGDIEADIRNIKAVRRGAKALVIANPGCPTGHMYSPQELNRLAKLGPTLIVDEVYLPLFDSGRLSRVSSKTAIHISGLSKSAGLSAARLGWIRASRETISKIRKAGDNLNIEMPTPSLQLGEVYLKNWSAALQPALEIIDRNFSLVSPLNPLVYTRGSFICLAVPKSYKSGFDFTRALLKKSVLVRPGELFDCPRTVRVSLVAEPAKFARGIAIIKGYY